MNRPRGVFKKPPIFVPPEFMSEVMAMSKAALADVAWNLAGCCVDSAEDAEQVIARLREEISITGNYRKAKPCG